MCSQVFSFQCNSPIFLLVLQHMSSFYIVPFFCIFLLFISTSTYAQSVESGYLFGLSDKECSGISLANSKYCSGFAPNFLAPTNIIPGLLYLLNNKEDDDAAAKPFLQAGYDRLKTVTEFDNVFTDTILPNANMIAGRQTSCPYKNYGVLGMITYSCQWLVNYGVIYPVPQNWFQTTCISKTGLGRFQGLCLASTNDFVSSARANFDKDPSCASTTKDNMLQRTDAYLEASKRVSNRNDTSSSCISWQRNEANLNLCGYATKIQACLNSCKANSLDCNQVLNGYVMSSSDPTTSSGLKIFLIVLVVIIFIVAHLILGILIYLRVKKIPIKAFLESIRSKISNVKSSKGSSSTSTANPTPWLTYDSQMEPSDDMKDVQVSINSINDDLKARSSLFDLKTPRLGPKGTTFSETSKLTLPSVSSVNDPFKPTTSPTSSLLGAPKKPSPPSVLGSGILSGLSSNPSSWVKPTKSSLLSQPPLTMPSTPDDDDAMLALSSAPFAKKHGPQHSPLQAKRKDPLDPDEAQRSSLTSVPLPRHLPSTIGSATPVLTRPPSTVVAASSLADANGKSRTQSLISTHTTDSVMFRRETLLRANSMLSTSILVKHEFEPARNDEIALSPGDKVVVITRYEDGWGWGCKYDKESGKEEVGAFPLNCLEDHTE